MAEDKKYRTYAIGYANATPQEEQMAEFGLFSAIRAFVETVEIEPGKYAKVLRANFAMDPEEVEEKPKSKLIMPDSGLLVN